MKSKKSRKFLALMLTLTVMVTTVLGVSPDIAIAAPGPGDGQIEYVGGITSTQPDATYDIAVSKTIKAVEGKENYFDITLQTTTHRHKIDMSTDVVLVLDVSNTMNSDANGNDGVADAKKKLTYAKNATKKFVKSFAENTNLDSNRKIGIVTFNRDAKVTVPLTTANKTSHYTSIGNKIDAITAPSESEVKWTNIQGGLKLAENMLKSSTAKYKYVILLTDGFPTTYLEKPNTTTVGTLAGYTPIMSGTYNKAKAETNNNGEGTLGYFANTRTKELNTGGVSYSNRAAEKAQVTADAMHKAGINIFSVGVALGSQNLKDMWSYIIDTTGMESGEAYVIGTSAASYTKWLQDDIAGGPLLEKSNNRYTDAYNQKELESDFAQIMGDIERAPETTMREFYTLDPMSDVADFVGFFNKDGKLLAKNSNLLGESKENAENTAVFGGANNANRINWNMIQSGFKMDGENLVFTLKYRVRLKNEKSGFSWQKAYDTNNTTTLNYSQKYAGTNTDVPGGTGTMEYKIPEVEGYKGSLKFQKVNENGTAFANVEFTLQHYGENCSVCGGDATIADETKKSDSSGVVSFDNIPSGHEYVLIETEPVGYAPVHNHAITVSYGDTYVGSVVAANKLVDGRFVNRSDSDNKFIITNTKDEPVEIRMSVSKAIDGKIPEAGAFEFLLAGQNIHGDTHHEHARNDNNGVVTFKNIIFDTPGTYHYEISEVTGTNPNIVYDGSKHTVDIEITAPSGDRAYHANITVNNGKANAVTHHFTGKDNVIELLDVGSFSNQTREECKVALGAKKAYEGTPTGTLFTFAIEPITEGAPLPDNLSVSRSGIGEVSFEPIVYTEPGIYQYRISEVRDSDRTIVYDTTVYEATVTVTAPDDLTSSDRFSTSVVYKNTKTGATSNEVPVFTNKDRLMPELTMKGYKTLNGKPAQKDAFTFVFQEYDHDGQLVADGFKREVTNGADGIINFDDILHEVVEKAVEQLLVTSTPDITRDSIVHTYRIFEKEDSFAYETATESNAEIKYDDVYYELHVDAYIVEGYDHYSLFVALIKVDGDDTELVYHRENGYHLNIADVDLKPVVTFENTSNVKLELTAEKILETEDESLTLIGFDFVLEDKHGVIQRKESDINGDIVFDPITFTVEDVGTNSFVVYEEEGNDPGLFYDDSLYIVTVDVEVDDYGNLTISEPRFTDEYDVDNIPKMEFLNKDLVPTHLHLYARKTVNDEMPTIAQRFDFGLYKVNTSSNAEKLDLIETIHNVHEYVAFTYLEFEEKGTYSYVIKEILPEDEDGRELNKKDGFTYDTEEYRIDVIVTGGTSSPSNASPSNADALTKKVYINGKKVDAEHNTVIVGFFNNRYEAAPVDVTLKGTKALIGRELQADEFRFLMETATPSDAIKLVASASNAAGVSSASNSAWYEGEFTFDTLTFDKVGTYEYTIREASASDDENSVPGVTYDQKVYQVKIIVTDDGKGQLVAKVLVDGVENGEIEFVNKYHARPTGVRFVADKTLEGRTLQHGEFAFRLVEVDNEGQEIDGTEQIVTNGTSFGTQIEKVYFAGIIYDTVGRHVYKISEVLPEEEDKQIGVTYDETVYYVTVEVTDNFEEGRLVASTTYEFGGAQKESIVFKNKFEAPPVEVVIDGLKQFKEKNGKPVYIMKAGEFKFALMDGKTEVFTAENDEDGYFVFEPLEFKKEGTYKYTVIEKDTGIKGVKYDKSIYDVTVVVEREADGLLSVEWEYKLENVAKDEILFINDYSKTPKDPEDPWNDPDDPRDPKDPKDPTNPTEPVNPNDPGSSGEPGTDGGEGEKSEGFNLNVLPLTGDNTVIWPYVILGILALTGIVVLVKSKKKDKDEE